MSQDATGAAGKLLEGISSETRRLLLQDMLRERKASRDRDGIPRRSSPGPLPLSYAQQRLWLVDRLEPGNAAYNMPSTLRLCGALDAAALRGALDRLVQRHETLRTTFEERGGAPVQVVQPPAPVPLPVLDLRALPEGEREREARRLTGAEAVLPFDLARGPLMRAQLMRLGDQDHVLCFTLHHIVSDGWSMDVLVREVSALYRAFGADDPAELPELPVQYGDFAVWQRNRLGGSVLEKDLAYWTERLAGAPPLLEIPTDQARAAVQSASAGNHHFTLPLDVSRGLRALAEAEGATLFMALLAGWQTLLGRYAGQEDVVVGSPVAGRTRPETEGLIGFFVNLLALRADLGGDPSWRELLRRIRQTALEAYAHQELPFERVVEELVVERSLEHAPLFQVIFALERGRGPDERLRLGGLTLEPFGDGGASVAQFDLSLTVADRAAALSGRITFRAALFEADTIERMAGHLQALFREMVRSPDGRLSEAGLLSAAERRQVVEAWSSATSEYPPACVHELFAVQSARTPDAAAVVFGDRVLTYAELDRRANRLAHRLRSLGVGPEARVAVCVERSAELVVALLAVLKAGGAYVPVDPAYPAERIAYLLADSGCAVVLVQGGLRALLGDTGMEVLVVEDALRTPGGEWAPEVEVDPENAAYVIYTSGSTGRPKGVVVTHQSVTRLFAATRAWFDFAADDAWTLFHSYAFDFSVWEMWGALLHGGRLVVVPWQTSRDPEAFYDLLVREGVTVLNQTPSAFQQLAAAEEVRGAPHQLAVRVVVFGGEALEPRSLRGWMERHGEEKPRLVNMYGITETTVHVTYRPVGWADVAVGEGSPVGRPIPDLEVRVLDGWGSPAPVGVPGELYVGGAGVARGYLGRPELTAQRFVPDALGKEPGARLYRTGDRMRWSRAGELEFLGRADTQVKVRGFRIEPGEIEAVLVGLAGVREAIVVAREVAPGDRRLVAYVVPQAGVQLSAAELRVRSGSRLPEHMVPGGFIVLERLPLNDNGKVDRGALPAPDSSAGGEEGYVPARTPTEEVLAGIWAEVLGVERVGVEDGFFQLGGHSLLATEVVWRARQAFGVEVPLRAVFEAPTVAQLAERIEVLRSAGGEAAPPIERVPRSGPLPMSFAQQRLWVVNRMDPDSAAYNIPYAIRLRGRLDVAMLECSIGELVRRHEILRTTLEEREGTPVQVVHADSGVALETTDLRDRPVAEREPAAQCIAADEALRPFDLSRGPLLRVRLVRLDEDDHVLCFTLHHVVSDGWSTDVLVREISALYRVRDRGEASPLRELPVQYADYAVWQRKWLSGEVLDAQLAYWTERLAGAPPLLEIPVDRPRSAAVASPRGATHSFALSPELSEGLRALSRREGTTLFMTLLAAWQALLGRWAGQEEVVVGTPIAGRTRQETEGLIGFFVNMLALRAELGGDPTWRELLGRVREAALGAYAHQELPFERLIEELGVERSLTHAPVFQVVFALNGSGGRDERLSLGDLELEPFETGAEVAKFDVNLTFADGGDGLSGALVYREALFEAETVVRMAGHLGAVLEALAADPERRVGALSLLRGAERAQVLEAWNATAAPVPAGSVHERFAQQAARTPQATAVVFQDRSLSYAELARRANQLAHLLRRRGVGPEVRVGLCVERSVEMVVGVLGILQAGGAYVPLDPASPAERLAYTLADAGAAVLLTQATLLPAGLPGFAGALVRLDAERAAMESEPGEPPRPLLGGRAGARAAAYVIYTSGSTGTPKGVVVEHGSLSNYLAFFEREVLGEAGYALPLVSRLSFDAHVRQLFPPLLRGEAVWVLPERAATDPAALLEALCTRERVSFGGVPTLWSAVLERVERGESAAPPGLVAVLLGGEAIPEELVRRTRARFAEVALWNHYGPTEATVNTTVARVEVAEGVRLGRPIANVRVYVVDRAGQPVPVGMPGELYVGGAGVTRGYLGQPELTAERYVPDGFGSESGARLYRSGDRVRWVGSGELEYLGRLDAQVKVRGYRIEPGEIEAALRGCAGVREAAVLLREDVAGQARLVAYVAGEAGAELRERELREHLSQRLPEYMVPAAYVVVEALPVTANGKVDRRALPAPERVWEGTEAGPRTAAEEVLAGIWAEVLGREGVGVEESFFELGGHSLLATQVVSRARRAFGVELPLRALFEAPTVAGLAGRIEALRSEGAAVAPPIVPVPREGGPLPVSFAQQRLWVVDRLEPGSAAYNMAYALRLRGALDASALRASLAGLVGRHETLRTTLAEHEGVPVQVIHPPAPVPLPVLELRGLPAAAREREAERLAGAEGLRPFDLSRGPLLRAQLIRLGEQDHVLCFTLHHVVSDGWSRDVLVREVSALYGAFRQGESPVLPELPVQYADFALWQRAWLSGDVLEAHLGYWKEKLGGAPPLLEIPTDRPRAPGRSPLAASHAFALSPELSEGLRALSRREGTTLFMTLLAAWQALLGRWAGQEEVVVGTPIAGRTRQETEGLIGFFVNMLALRAELGGDPTWRELLGRVREAALGAYDHQELPFERLVEELGVERSLTHSPLFQSTFALDPSAAQDERLELGGLALEPFGAGEGIAKFDLDLVFVDAGEALSGVLVYREALFEAETIGRMAAHLEILLEALASDPERPVGEPPLLRGAERARVLEAWNATARPVPAGCVHELFARQAARTPEAVALVHGGEPMSYAELAGRVDRLALRLRALGVGPEARVGICLERSAEMIVSVLASLAAGGAYVPIDPAYPAERAGYLLADAGVSVLLTQATLAGRFAGFAGEVVLVGAEAALAAPAPEPWAPAASERNLAYVIYTSGSAGTPKGVGVEHASLANYAYAAREFFAITAADRVLQFASLSFDTSAEEIYPTLLSGATLVLRTEEMLGSAARFFEQCAGWGVTVLDLPTAYWHELVGALQRGEARLPGCVRLVVVGGERMQGDRVGQWRRSVGEGAGLVNGYGPTEATVVATLGHVGEGRLTIGAPVGNVRVYVLEPTGEPSPVGVPGELWIGGAGVARGYLGRADATAERFGPDPFTGESGARMYRSGDRVRWVGSGELEYLGRLDAQVKVRGYRIEPGEVEAVLRAYAGVGEAVVVVVGEEAGERRLVGYVKAEAGAGVGAAEVRAWLKGRLPGYMVPAAVVVVEDLPLTASGKVDRRALPAPEWSDGEAGPQSGPRTPTEELLGGMWAEVLGRERVGVEESFFDLGGHSLLGTRVVSRVREAFGVELPLRALFEAPTVAGLAGRIEALRSEGAAVAPPIVPVPREGGPLPVSFAQQRLWVVDRLEPGSAAYNMPFALRLRGALDASALRASLAGLVGRHETLRTTLAAHGGVPVQVVHPAAPVPLPVLELRGLPAAAREREAERLASAEAQRPFDLAQGPLLRAQLIRLGEQDHVLCFTLHHVVSDGWSMDVLVREVSDLYGAFSRGKTPVLPVLPVQYADFALWQRAWLSGDVLEAQVGYWKEHLGGAPPLLEIPTDRPRAPGRSPLAASHAFALSPELSEGLRALSRREGTTLFMTLLAAWQALLGRWAGQEEVVVGTPIAGRTRQETEGLIGFFVNMLALRAELGGDPTWRELLGRVREAALGAYAHQDLPFERLVEELGVERSLAYAPVFQVVFALNKSSDRDERLSLGDLELEPFGGGGGLARFDLDLVLSDADGGDGLRGALVYREALFEAETIVRMAGHLGAVLEALAADPERRVGALSLLRGAERAQVLEAWNATAAPVPAGSVHERFAQQAARTPQATAVVFQDRSLSYAELARRANQLAHLLRRRGVGPEVRVGLCVERSVEMVVGVLGILQAGGAYVPLDPASPAERLAYTLADAGAAVLLTQATLLPAGLPGFAGALVRLDAERAAMESEPGEPPRPLLGGRAGARAAAYVIYTSGSTGTPKGVVVEHGSLSNYLAFFEREVLGEAGYALPLVSRLSFDAHVRQLFPPLLRGEAVWVLPERAATDPAALLEALCTRERVSFGGVPTLWSAVLERVERGESAAPPGLVAVLLGGRRSRRSWSGARGRASRRWRSGTTTGRRRRRSTPRWRGWRSRRG